MNSAVGMKKTQLKKIKFLGSYQPLVPVQLPSPALLLFTSDPVAHLIHSLPFVPFLPYYIPIPASSWRRVLWPLFHSPHCPDCLGTPKVPEDLTTEHCGLCSFLAKACSRSIWLSTQSLAKQWRKQVIYCSIFSFSEPPKMNPVVEPLSWMLGTWLSDPPGVGTFPTLQPFQYLEEVHISHVGQPMLNFS